MLLKLCPDLRVKGLAFVIFLSMRAQVHSEASIPHHGPCSNYYNGQLEQPLGLPRHMLKVALHYNPPQVIT